MPVAAHVLDEREVGQIRRADLVGGEVAGLEEVDAAAIPRRAERGDSARRGSNEQLAELVVRQFELDQQRDDVLQSLLAVARLVDDLLAIGLAQLALLELDRVRARVDGGVDELLGDCQIAVVIDPDLGDHVAGLAAADAARSDLKRALSVGH